MGPRKTSMETWKRSDTTPAELRNPASARYAATPRTTTQAVQK
jgi:hypothetical protein